MFFAKRILKAAPPLEASFHSRKHGLRTPQTIGWLMARDRREIEKFFTQTWAKEDLFQINLIDTLYAITADDFECWSVPNEGHRTAAACARHKRLGMRAGVFDLDCGWTGGTGRIECKSKNGKPTRAQSEFGTWWTRIGGNGAYAKSIAGVVHALVTWGAPVKPEFTGIGRLLG